MASTEFVCEGTMKKLNVLVQINSKFEKLTCTFQNRQVFDSNNVALDRKAAFISEGNENNGAVVTQALHSGYTYLGS
jgi:hypothetical protein